MIGLDLTRKFTMQGSCECLIPRAAWLQMTGKDIRRRQVKPHNLRLDRAKIPAQQRPNVHPPDPPFRNLHRDEILVLGKDSLFMNEGHQVVKNRRAQCRRHKTQPKRRHHGVHSLDSSLPQLRVHIFNAGIDKRHSRIKESLLQVPDESRIDLKDEQSPVSRQVFKERPRHRTSARAEFHNHRSRHVRHVFDHSGNKLGRARRDRCSRLEVRKCLCREYLEAHFLSLPCLPEMCACGQEFHRASSLGLNIHQLPNPPMRCKWRSGEGARILGCDKHPSSSTQSDMGRHPSTLGKQIRQIADIKTANICANEKSCSNRSTRISSTSDCRSTGCGIVLASSSPVEFGNSVATISVAQQ
jgi:hypothetical protein